MKINKNFLTHDDGDNKLLVSTGAVKFSGIVKGNLTAGFIIECLGQDVTEDEIVEKMIKKWDISYEIARRDVKNIINKLRSIGAIDE